MALFEADHRADGPHHPHDAWRQRRIFQPERVVAWTEARFARIAMGVGPLEGKLSQHAGEAFVVAARVTRRLLTAKAR